MAERNILESVIEMGDVIRNYSYDTPYPSRLILGWSDDRPLHVIAADDDETNETIVITIYQPDPDIWNKDFKSKKS